MGDILSFQCFDGVEYKDIICENVFGSAKLLDAVCRVI